MFENEFNVLKNAMLTADGLAKTVVSDAPIKNEGGADVGGEPPSQKSSLSIALSFIDAATIQTDILVDLPLMTVNGKSKDINLVLRICANSTVYLGCHHHTGLAIGRLWEGQVANNHHRQFQGHQI